MFGERMKKSQSALLVFQRIARRLHDEIFKRRPSFDRKEPTKEANARLKSIIRMRIDCIKMPIATWSK